MTHESALVHDGLSIEAIRRGLVSETVGSKVCIFWEVPSTNSVLRKMAEAGATDGTVVLAEAQTAARGRRGQRWFSPLRRNLYASALFRPRIAPAEVPVLSFISALAVTDAIRMEGLWGAIKWPNDVLVNGKKVGGTLAESAIDDGEVRYVILGVGVNLNVEEAALRDALGRSGLGATSLREETGRLIDRNAFAAAFLSWLDRWYSIYASKGPDPVLAAWRDRDILTGRRVEVVDEGQTVDGRVRGVSGDGRLLVEDSRGGFHPIAGGQIRVLD
jgi:BirA family biotin operon repressor/biotin-[acetyl-CoA-carboxylase] ligase